LAKSAAACLPSVSTKRHPLTLGPVRRLRDRRSLACWSVRKSTTSASALPGKVASSHVGQAPRRANGRNRRARGRLAYVSATSSLASVVMIANVRIHSPEARSFQFSHPATLPPLRNSPMGSGLRNLCPPASPPIVTPGDRSPPGYPRLLASARREADRARPMATQPHHPWGCWIFAGRAPRSRSNNLVISTTEQHAALPYQGSAGR